MLVHVLAKVGIVADSSNRRKYIVPVQCRRVSERCSGRVFFFSSGVVLRVHLECECLGGGGGGGAVCSDWNGPLVARVQFASVLATGRSVHSGEFAWPPLPLARYSLYLSLP